MSTLHDSKCRFESYHTKQGFDINCLAPVQDGGFLFVDKYAYICVIILKIEEIMAKPSWVTLSESSGTGGGSVQVTAAKNSGDSRSGSITVKTTSGLTKSVSISQSSVPKYSVSGAIEFYRTQNLNYSIHTYVTIGLKVGRSSYTAKNIYSGTLYFDPDVQMQQVSFSQYLNQDSANAITGLQLTFEDEGGDRRVSSVSPASSSRSILIDGTTYNLLGSSHTVQDAEPINIYFSPSSDVYPQTSVTFSNCNFTISSN